MPRYCNMLAIILVACLLGLGLGCTLLPIIDPHGHEQSKDDEHDEHGEHAEEPPAPPEEEDMDLAMHPPEIREAIKNTTVDGAIEMLKTPGEDAAPDAVAIVGYVYKKAGKADRKRLEDAAVECLKNANDPMLRRTALLLLSGFENSHMDLRIKAARSDGDPSVRLAAVGSLQSDGMAARAILKELTGDSDGAIRQLAQDQLINLMGTGGDEGLKTLVQDLGVYKNDASALASISLVVKGEQALPYLIDAALNDPNDHRRAAATTCIAMICAGNNPSLDEFAQRAQATRHEERTPVPAKLKGLEPMLKVLANDSYAPAREAAAQGLGYLGSAKAAPVLAEALSDPDKHVRRRAAAALETVPADAVVERIADAAKNDKEAIVRSYAVRALGSIGPQPLVISALARATEDTNSEVRQSAAEELGHLKAGQALEPLVGLFNDPDEDVRWAAVRAVGDLRDERATPYLVKAIEDEVPQVSNAAERGLQKLGIGKRKGLGFDREIPAPANP